MILNPGLALIRGKEFCWLLVTFRSRDFQLRSDIDVLDNPRHQLNGGGARENGYTGIVLRPLRGTRVHHHHLLDDAAEGGRQIANHSQFCMMLMRRKCRNSSSNRRRRRYIYMRKAEEDIERDKG